MSTTLLKKALYFLAQRDHSRVELYCKLMARRFPESKVQQVIEYCCQQGWLDDQRFTQSYIQQRSRKGYGPIRIQGELQQLGIDKSLTANQLSASHINWTILAQRVIKQRFGNACIEYILLKNKEMYYKAARFLEYRGFYQSEMRNIERQKLID